MVPDNAKNTSESLAIRVDLTSQDLRTGTIRLPRRLHNHFEPGGLNALEAQGTAVHELQFQPPRELTGLQEFLLSHDLRPNDAVIMHVNGQQLRLEPYYRNHRRAEAQEGDHVKDSGEGQPAVQGGAPGPSDGESPEDAATPPFTEDGAQEDAGDRPLNSPKAAEASDTVHKRAGASEETAQETGAMQPASPDTKEPGGASAVAGPAPDLAPIHTAAESVAPPVDSAAPEPSSPQTGPADAFDSFADSDPFDADEFDSYDSMDELGELDAGDLDLLPPRQSGGESVPERLDTANNRDEQATASGPVSVFHAVQRRPFPLRRASGPADHPGNTAGRTANPYRPATVPSAAETGEAPAARSAAGKQALQAQHQPIGTAAAVHDYLDGPNPPSILNVEELSRQLGFSAAELNEVLAGMSGQPDSRLSSVRPGFYLLKRKQAG